MYVTKWVLGAKNTYNLTIGEWLTLAHVHPPGSRLMRTNHALPVFSPVYRLPRHLE